VGHGHSSKIAVYRASPGYEVVGLVDPAERRRLAEFPGGMMFELGCHLIDLVVGVLGKPEAVTPFLQHAGAVADGLADRLSGAPTPSAGDGGTSFASRPARQAVARIHMARGWLASSLLACHDGSGGVQVFSGAL